MKPVNKLPDFCQNCFKKLQLKLDSLQYTIQCPSCGSIHRMETVLVNSDPANLHYETRLISYEAQLVNNYSLSR